MTNKTTAKLVLVLILVIALWACKAAIDSQAVVASTPSVMQAGKAYVVFGLAGSDIKMRVLEVDKSGWVKAKISIGSLEARGQYSPEEEDWVNINLAHFIQEVREK